MEGINNHQNHRRSGVGQKTAKTGPPHHAHVFPVQPHQKPQKSRHGHFTAKQKTPFDPYFSLAFPLFSCYGFIRSFFTWHNTKRTLYKRNNPKQ